MNTSPKYSKAPYVVTREAIDRRHFLRATGVALSLPFLNSMLRPFARAADAASPFGTGEAPRRMFAICNNLGVLHEHFFPTGAGSDYVTSPYLKLLDQHRKDFTVFTGVSHPNVDSGHPADVCFLTAAPHPGGGGFRNTISLDQVIAERIGILTRFPSLTLAVNSRARSLSYTGTGVAIPPQEKASEVYKQLFFQGTEAQIAAQITELDNGRSILDAVAVQAKELQKKLGAEDRDRVEQYFTSVRDLENRLQASKGWERKPRPAVTAPAPVDPQTPAQYMEKVKVMYDLAMLAFQTDSTRSITLMLDSVSTPVVEGIPGIAITDTYHNLSHHGKDEDKLGQLKALDLGHMKLLDRLYSNFKGVSEGGGTLLDRTIVLYGSNFGDANQHVNTNMPILLAGGGFKHGQHLVFDKERNYPLPNLYVSMLQRLGLEQDRFASSTGTMRGLETV